MKEKITPLICHRIRSLSFSYSLSIPLSRTPTKPPPIAPIPIARAPASSRDRDYILHKKTRQLRCRQPHQRPPPRPLHPPPRFDASPSSAALRRARGPSSGRPPWRSVLRWQGGASGWCTEVRERGVGWGRGGIGKRWHWFSIDLLDLLSRPQNPDTFSFSLALKQNQQAATSA